MYRRGLGIVGAVAACLTAAFLGALPGTPARGQDAPEIESDVRNVGLVLDCSGSMLDKLPDGTTKIDVAKRVVVNFLNQIPNGKKLTFIVYGLNPRLKCEDIQVVRPLTEVTDALKKQLTKFVNGLVPLGQTPLAKSMEVAGVELAKGEPFMSQLVVVTDGIESCKGNPGAVANNLANTLNLYDQHTVMIGLGVSKAEKVILDALARPSLQVIQTDSEKEIKEELDRFQSRPERRKKIFSELEKDTTVRLEKAKAGRGPLEVALAWSNKNDLDLHVKPPSNEEIFYKHQESKCGGKQDVDMNVDYKGASMRPVEHIVWSKKAPAGKYEVWVHHYRNHHKPDCKDPTPFVVSVKFKGETRFFRGAIANTGIDKNRRLVIAFNIGKKGEIRFVEQHKGPRAKSGGSSGGASLFRGLLPDGDRLTASATALDGSPRACGCLPRIGREEPVVRLAE